MLKFQLQEKVASNTCPIKHIQDITQNQTLLIISRRETGARPQERQEEF